MKGCELDEQPQPPMPLPVNIGPSSRGGVVNASSAHPMHLVKRLGRVEYEPTYQTMRNFTASRTADTPDEIWIVEHPPVYTLGQAGKPEHILRNVGIPLVQIDRGGQVTYHGPGQVVVYLLLDLARMQIKVRELVSAIEQAVIDLLGEHGVIAERRTGAPGVYVGEAKIAALGLRIRNGCSYHGVSLNVDMDLSPFEAINPCGYAGLRVIQTRDLNIPLTAHEAGERLSQHLLQQLDQRHG